MPHFEVILSTPRPECEIIERQVYEGPIAKTNAHKYFKYLLDNYADYMTGASWNPRDNELTVATVQLTHNPGFPSDTNHT